MKMISGSNYYFGFIFSFARFAKMRKALQG